ncbi:unnamed protein product, partial [Tilletia controversa]
SFLGFAACKVNEEPNGPVIECVKALWTFFHAEYLTISKSNTVDIHSVAMNAAAFDEQCLLCDYFTAYVTLEKQGKLPLLPTPKLLSLAGKADAGIFALFGGQARQGTNEVYLNELQLLFNPASRELFADLSQACAQSGQTPMPTKPRRARHRGPRTFDGSDLRAHTEEGIPRSILRQIFDRPVHWSKATNSGSSITHCVDFGTGGLSGIGALTAFNLQGQGVRVIIASGMHREAAELHDLLKVQREEPLSRRRSNIIKSDQGLRFNFDVNPPLAILAQKLKKPIAYIPLSNAIKDMVGDKSTSENELIGDLQLEFGSLPERGEEMPLEELGSTLNSGYSGTLGKHTTGLVSRIVGGAMVDYILIDNCKEAMVESARYKEVHAPTAPHTEIDTRGNIVYPEAKRIGVRKLEAYVKEMAVGICAGPQINVEKAHENIEKLWMLIKNDTTTARPSSVDAFTMLDDRQPFLNIQRKVAAKWQASQKLTSVYFSLLEEMASNGITFKGQNALLTGVGKGSTGLAIVRGLLAGGARVIITTSSYSRATVEYYQRIYEEVGARGSTLTVVPLNAGSRQNVDSLVDYIHDIMQLDLDFVLPFATILENGRQIDGIDNKSELAHRIMLTNVIRLLRAIKIKKAACGIETRPTLVVLPLSPNHGVFSHSDSDKGPRGSHRTDTRHAQGVLASVLNRFLASYVDGLNTSQLNVDIWSGDAKLRNLRLKTSALDKLCLPIDVKEGYLGDLALSISWSNLKGRPVRVLVENVYLPAAPKNATAVFDEDEEEERAQAAEQEKLVNVGFLGRNKPPAMGMSAADAQKNESFTSSLIIKIIDNVQITVRNTHIRYEDNLSNPLHPFSAGFTLAEFSAVSTDDNWNPAIVQSTYILKPVTGAEQFIMCRKMDADTPKMDAELLLEELGFALDDEQYQDIILVTDLFQFYNRQAQYRRLRPSTKELEENRARALLTFAGQAILNEVHEKHRKWSCDHNMRIETSVNAYVNYFNLSCSHWEPLIDPWTFSLNMDKTITPPSTNFTMSSKRRLELNITTTLIETALTYVTTINDQSIQATSNRDTTPFELRNRTGYRIAVWSDVEDKRQRPAPQYLEDGDNTPWRFEDWKSTREHIKESNSNTLSLQIEGMPWERLKHISVDREGGFVKDAPPYPNELEDAVLQNLNARAAPTPSGS